MKKDLMKSLSVAFVLLCGTLLATSCEKPFFAEEEEEVESVSDTNSTLIVNTRAGDTSDDTKVSYPVYIYVFNTKDKCVGVQTIISKNDAVNIKLPTGNYQVYAIATDYEESYDMPTQETATTQSLISLRDGQTHGDLMTGNANVTMGENEKNTLNIVLERKVMMLDNVEFSNIPTNAKEVKLTISPLYEGVTLNGDCIGTSGSQTFSLEMDGATMTWKNPKKFYLLASTSAATVKVSITDSNDQISSFSYVCQESLDANYKINITGKYIENSFEMSGTIQGTSWLGSKDINFDLRETAVEEKEEEKDQSEPIISSDAPAAGTFYKDHYVLKSETDGNTTTVTLLSLTEEKSLTYASTAQSNIKAAVDETLSSMEVNDITLRLPTFEELAYIRENATTINTTLKNNGKKYLYIDTGNSNTNGYYYLTSDNKISLYFFADGIDGMKALNSNASYLHLRGFATLTFTNK